ncbi:hypothetical protein O0L34_g16041 [Tuta absoluta]|nr:hypothetical protein O0L34_g16041 [Tuta absoluta]
MPRVKYATVLRILFIIGIFCVWVQILLSATNDGLDRDGDELMNSNETSEQVLALVPSELHKYLTVHARNVSGNATDRNGTPRNVSEILRRIHKYNDAQTIYNEDIFGPVQNDTLIIAIQVGINLDNFYTTAQPNKRL